MPETIIIKGVKYVHLTNVYIGSPFEPHHDLRHENNRALDAYREMGDKAHIDVAYWKPGEQVQRRCQGVYIRSDVEST